jgi:hypothetical protein
MAENPRPDAPSARPENLAAPPKGAAPTAEAKPNGNGNAEPARRDIEQAARAAETVAQKTADASKEAVRANSEILRRNVESAQEAVRASAEVGLRSFEGLAQTVSRTFGVTMPNGEVADEASRDVQAISQASTALARGAQEASRAWLELVQQSVRSNLEAMSHLAACRSVPDLVAVQSHIMRDNLQRAIDSGRIAAQASTQAMEEASRLISPSAGQQPRP